MSTLNYEDFLTDALKMEAKRMKTTVGKLSKKATARITEEATQAYQDAILMDPEVITPAAPIVNVMPEFEVTGFIAAPVNDPIPDVKKAASPRQTKRSICSAIFGANPDARRKDVITMFMESEAEMTEAGAANYYQRFRTPSVKGGWGV